MQQRKWIFTGIIIILLFTVSFLREETINSFNALSYNFGQHYYGFSWLRNLLVKIPKERLFIYEVSVNIAFLFIAISLNIWGIMIHVNSRARLQTMFILLGGIVTAMLFMIGLGMILKSNLVSGWGFSIMRFVLSPFIVVITALIMSYLPVKSN